MNLTNFRTLGRSGLVVSPFALGTMTFGTQRWGSDETVSEAVFNAYVDAGGNFIDTADIYSGGRSEELLGSYIENRRFRDQIVLATKFTWHGGDPANVNGGGNGRKNIQRALEGSLRRLRTDVIDLYWMHAWDMVTPVEEVLQSLGALQQSGKIRYFGFSDVPAWYAAKAATFAADHAVPGPIALQLEYSLVERSIEREHVPAARECGLGITPWSPLGGGFLAGKYARPDAGAGAAEKSNYQTGRLSGSNPFGDTKFTDRNWNTLDALRGVAAEIECPMAQVALAWVSAQPGVSSPILGASKPKQLKDNLASLEIRLAPEQLQVLDDSSALDPVHPYLMFNQEVSQSIFGASVQGWR